MYLTYFFTRRTLLFQIYILIKITQKWVDETASYILSNLGNF